MLKYLSALRRKKGFTIVELVIVIAVIAVLTAISASAMLSNDTSKQELVNANAETFFAGMQLTMTKAGMTERSLVDYQTETKYIEYKDGVNTTNNNYLFFEAKFTPHGIEYLHLDTTVDGLMSQAENKAMTKLEKYLLGILEPTFAEAYDGYFYAWVDNTFRVRVTHFSERRFPPCAAGDATYDVKIRFTDSGVKLNSLIVGTCCDGPVGEFAFGYTTAEKAKFFS